MTGTSFSPVNMHLLYSCGSDGLLACWDRRTSNEQQSVRSATGLSSLAVR